MTDDDTYLWDGTGQPDPDVQQLEKQLQGSRHRARPLPAELGARPLRWWPAVALAAAGLLASLWLWSRDAAPVTSPYRLDVLEGQVAGADEPLLPGACIETAADARARVHVGDIGSVLLEPASRLRVESVAAADEADWRLFLEQGSIEASIFAAPRLFQVGTPGGIAVDLGCVYRASVEEDGATRLAVVSGAVSFETEGRAVHVPAGASCRARPGAPPSPPCWDDDSATWCHAVERAGEGLADDADLAVIAAASEQRASLSLCHLLDAEQPSVRALVLQTLCRLVPPPSCADVPLCGDDMSMCATWMEEMRCTW